MGNFNGFNREVNLFLFQLQFCNSVEKQSENIVKYKEYITNPANELYLDLLEIVGNFNVNFDLKPAKCISTPYTDRRFSPLIPLKEYMYVRFRQSYKKKDMLGLYFDMGCDMYGYGLKIYKPTAAGLDNIRAKLIKNTELSSAMLKNLSDYGFSVRGRKYKTDHFPYICEGALKNLLNMSSFELAISKSVNENVYSNLLFSEISNAFVALKPFIEFLAE